MSIARSDFRFLHRLRVRWAEVDLQKIVFNPHYLMYLDTALADYWRAMGLPYEPTLAALGGELFLKKATLEYHASAVYDDYLDVGLRFHQHRLRLRIHVFPAFFLTVGGFLLEHLDRLQDLLLHLRHVRRRHAEASQP